MFYDYKKFKICKKLGERIMKFLMYFFQNRCTFKDDCQLLVASKKQVETTRESSQTRLKTGL